MSRLRKLSGVVTVLVLGSFTASGYGQTNAPAPVSPVGDVAFQYTRIDTNAILRAVTDLEATWPGKYDGASARQMVTEFTRRRPSIEQGLKKREADALKEAERFLAGFRAALLANPLLDADRILLLRRYFPEDRARNVKGADAGFRGLNSHSTADMRKNFVNEIAVLSDLRTTPKLTPVYKPSNNLVVRDLDLDFDARRLIFSGIDANDRWAVFEIQPDGSGLKQVTPADYPDVDYFDACYLPDGRLIVAATASLQGLPCENGNRPMALLYLWDPAKQTLRQLTFEQDSDWSPSVANDGRVLYTRWEYSDIMHYYSRILFTMNPDGTTQLAYYGSGSYFPTALLHVRAIPGEPHKVVGIVGGHHDTSESGRLTLLDPSLAKAYPFRYRPTSREWGRPKSFLRIMPEVLPAKETGFLQEIPGWGKDVVGDVCDGQTGNQWDLGKPHFIYPWPLGTSPRDGAGRYFLVAAKPAANQRWGIYLADVFDNVTLIAEAEDSALLEPILLQPRARPPAMPDRVNLDSKTATVHIADIHSGPGLAGVPRGRVKAIRLFAYHFGYNHTGGHDKVGVESSWDIKRVLGTVPVEEDGSALFTIPANTPIALQPLDEKGRALQLMRSWLVGMPGERVSCTGCHENNLTSVPTGRKIADRQEPRAITPFHGPARPFAFETELFPVVQKYCLGCHDGSVKQVIAGRTAPLMRNAREAYDALHPYVRRPGPESELEMFYPMEYHASTSPLVRILEKDHYGVRLDREAWERLFTWIDLNAPWRGAWAPPGYRGFRSQVERRRELSIKFAGVDDDPEAEFRRAESEYRQRPAPAFIRPEPRPAAVPAAPASVPGFPMTAAQAQEAQRALGTARRTLKLSGDIELEFVRIPAGAFVMGAADGLPDEQPRAVVRIAKPFWMSVHEIRNRDYHLFDPKHDTRYIDQHGKDHNFPGYIANHDDQPVARVSWQEAQAFCRWLSDTHQVKAALPTEAQWEWAARAGADTRFFFGGIDDDFSRWANLAGREVRWHQVGYDGGSTIQVRHPYPTEMNFPLHENRFEDQWFVVDYVGQYEAHPWGLKDIIGNVSEWTRTSYRPYPYREDDGRNSGEVGERKVARGGSWDTRPRDAGAAIRYAYESWQKVHDVGFRVIIEE